MNHLQDFLVVNNCASLTRKQRKKCICESSLSELWSLYSFVWTWKPLFETHAMLKFSDVDLKKCLQNWEKSAKLSKTKQENSFYSFEKNWKTVYLSYETIFSAIWLIFSVLKIIFWAVQLEFLSVFLAEKNISEMEESCCKSTLIL